MKPNSFLFLLLFIVASCVDDVPVSNILFFAGEENGFDIYMIEDTVDCMQSDYNELEVDVDQNGTIDIRFQIYLDTNIVFSQSLSPITQYSPFRSTILINNLNDFHIATSNIASYLHVTYQDTFYDFYGTFPRETILAYGTNHERPQSESHYMGHVVSSFLAGTPIPENLNYSLSPGANFLLYRNAVNNALYSIIVDSTNLSLSGHWNCFEKVDGTINSNSIYFLPFIHTVNNTLKHGWLSLKYTSDFKLIVIKSAYQNS
ncbi:MAG: hypothetical protein KDC84_13630 [Crocinitomicaceae bacterium]|nr:hypothetical protein [Crocinitomicaceae bacterium]